jgi:hypothetical protein
VRLGVVLLDAINRVLPDVGELGEVPLPQSLSLPKLGTALGIDDPRTLGRVAGRA